jgi:hypothetical protein
MIQAVVFGSLAVWAFTRLNGVARVKRGTVK